MRHAESPAVYRPALQASIHCPGPIALHALLRLQRQLQARRAAVQLYHHLGRVGLGAAVQHVAYALVPGRAHVPGQQLGLAAVHAHPLQLALAAAQRHPQPQQLAVELALAVNAQRCSRGRARPVRRTPVGLREVKAAHAHLAAVRVLRAQRQAVGQLRAQYAQLIRFPVRARGYARPAVLCQRERGHHQALNALGARVVPQLRIAKVLRAHREAVLGRGHAGAVRRCEHIVAELLMLLQLAVHGTAALRVAYVHAEHAALGLLAPAQELVYALLARRQPARQQLGLLTVHAQREHVVAVRVLGRVMPCHPHVEAVAVVKRAVHRHVHALVQGARGACGRAAPVIRLHGRRGYVRAPGPAQPRRQAARHHQHNAREGQRGAIGNLLHLSTLLQRRQCGPGAPPVTCGRRAKRLFQVKIALHN